MPLIWPWWARYVPPLLEQLRVHVVLRFELGDMGQKLKGLSTSRHLPNIYFMFNSLRTWHFQVKWCFLLKLFASDNVPAFVWTGPAKAFIREGIIFSTQLLSCSEPVKFLSFVPIKQVFAIASLHMQEWRTMFPDLLHWSEMLRIIAMIFSSWMSIGHLLQL